MGPPKIEVAAYSQRYRGYFDWLIAGLGILAADSEIELAVANPQPWETMFLGTAFGKVPLPRLFPNLYNRLFPPHDLFLVATLKNKGKSMRFALDASDSPFLFSPSLLEAVDVYFKCQCPIAIEVAGFPLNSQIRIPYHPYVHTFASKIRPAMLGRPLARSRDPKRLIEGLREWENYTEVQRDIEIFASFGTDQPPPAFSDADRWPSPWDYSNEGLMLRRWGDAIGHPNVKRGRVVALLREMENARVDARVFRTGNETLRGPMLSAANYQDKLRRSFVNINVSGYRRSLPYRFTDTFVSGGMIATDKLAVKWYLPFETDVEVSEFGDLGYEQEDRVDWGAVKGALNGLALMTQDMADHASAVRSAYRSKWCPQAFARYVVRECLSAM